MDSKGDEDQILTILTRKPRSAGSLCCWINERELMELPCIVLLSVGRRKETRCHCFLFGAELTVPTREEINAHTILRIVHAIRNITCVNLLRISIFTLICNFGRDHKENARSRTTQAKRDEISSILLKS